MQICTMRREKSVDVGVLNYISRGVMELSYRISISSPLETVVEHPTFVRLELYNI
jgi:hypothetical protein